MFFSKKPITVDEKLELLLEDLRPEIAFLERRLAGQEDPLLADNRERLTIVVEYLKAKVELIEITLDTRKTYDQK